MNVLSNYLLYKYNDMSSVFYEASVKGGSVVAPWSIDFLSIYTLRIFIIGFGLIAGANLLALFYMTLNALSGYLLFNKIAKNKVFAVLFSGLYVFSTYFLFRVISFTPNLYAVFIFPLTLYLLLKNTKPVYLGLLNFFFLCLSSYYAFFNLIVIGLWYLLDRKPLNVAKFLIPIIIGALIFFLPYLKQNSYLSDYEKTGSNTVYRPIEDWYNFSFRPWYFAIPPGSSLFFGDLHTAFYNKVRSTGNYLTQNYSEDEMAGSYLGWHFILGAAVMFYLVVLRNKAGTQDTSKIITKCFWIIGVILLISGPPSVTVAGFKLYTPSYLLYYILPVFRSLVRWSAVLYLLVLVINYYLVIDLYSKIQSRLFKYLFVVSCIGLNFVVFAIKLPIIDVSNPPKDVVTLSKLDGRSLVYYPEADYYALFWSQVVKKEIINPKNTIVLGQPSKEFTADLLLGKGLDLFAKSNTRYLIYNKSRDTTVEPTLNKLYGPSVEAGNGVFIYPINGANSIN
jgi:hypothetical protein